ncbi:MAG TPA: hypothetical protein VEV84_09330, partial [Pyrinomonadaceae bacterium]|nr:hypothetical protein [Pyrinomonadaceae bacterium]
MACIASFEMDMKRQVLNNAELDRLAAALLKSSALRHGEIEEIAAREDLFLSVKRRIAAETIYDQQLATGSVLFSRPRVFAFASLIAILTVLFTVEAIFNRSNAIRKTPQQQPVARFDNPAAPPQERITSEEQPPQREPNYEMAVTKTGSERPTPIKTIYRPARNVQAERPEPQPIEFYALADMNSNESVSGGMVIRVDLPRASLVSLGVNVPLGSDKQLIKADLLVGPDGVPRAIRVVE